MFTPVSEMNIRAITIEREFGCGGSEIASKLAELLGWKLWDQELTAEIARLTHSTPQAVERREWRSDPMVYRVFKSFLRGAFEGGLPPTDRLELLDSARIAAVSEQAVSHAISGGPCVIVGRGSQYFLRERKDVFRVFLYASRNYKIHRLISNGTPQEEAITQVDTIDRDRAAFVRTQFKLNWPERNLYHAMFNTQTGGSFVAETIVRCVLVSDDISTKEFRARMTVNSFQIRTAPRDHTWNRLSPNALQNTHFAPIKSLKTRVYSSPKTGC